MTKYVTLVDGKIVSWAMGLSPGIAETPISDEEFDRLILPPVSYDDLFPTEFLLGMLRLNITPEMVDTAIAALPEPDRTIASIYWTRADKFKRADPLVDQIAGVFGKTPEDVNDVWLQQQSLRT